MQTRQAFGQLSNALQSGNLNAAQSAYNTLAASPLAQNGPFASAIQQIGQDLASGDLADAQKALASLQQQQQQQKAHGHHHHHGGIKPPDQTDSTDQTQSSSASQSSASDPDGGGDTDASSVGTVADTDPNHSVNITA